MQDFFSINKPMTTSPCQKLLHPKPSHIVSASHPRHNAPANGGVELPREVISWEVNFWCIFLGVETTSKIRTRLQRDGDFLGVNKEGDFGEFSGSNFVKAQRYPTKTVEKMRNFVENQEILSPWIYPFSQGLKESTSYLNIQPTVTVGSNVNFHELVVSGGPSS